VDDSVEVVTARDPWVRDTLVDIRAMVLSGIWLGALVGGVGGRLAMLLLRATSSSHVHGVTSDDGFFLGRVTLAGTYNLIAVGAAIGIIGAAAYRWVEHWLLGPSWFRQLTAALGAGAVVGGMLVHTDGVDFNVLEPEWLAVTLFVLVPALFAFFIGPLQRRLDRPDSPLRRGRRGWLVLAVFLIAFPPNIVIATVAAVVTLIWTAFIRRSPEYESLRDNRVYGAVVRAAWLVLALAGLAGLLSDAQEILA
jgi:hypothetical protein